MEQDCCRRFLIDGIRTTVGTAEEDILQKAKDKMKRAGLLSSTLHFRLFRKAIDARDQADIRFVSTVLVERNDGRGFSPSQVRRVDGRELREEAIEPVFGNIPMQAPPLVVGMGPAGLFAALLLAESGYAPVIIDRGQSVEERAKSVEAFRSTGLLDPNSNIQFGAGGAGTFSDGKLVTRIHDPKGVRVLETLVRFGAPQDILTKAKPHVGTDLLRGIVSGILSRIEALGGKVLYSCRMEDFCELADGSLSVKTTKGTFAASAMILAVGHSARDTYELLLEKGFSLEQKPISVGVRVEHLQEDIDRAMFGRFAGHPDLGPAEYNLSDTRGTRGVYTFCMCPGGEVVPAASEEGGLVVNGMSYHARGGANANSAVVVSVLPEDIQRSGKHPVLDSIAFQRRLEQKAFQLGGGDYTAPVMTLGDLLSGTHGTEPSRITPSYRDGRIRVADLTAIYPQFVNEQLCRGFASFGKRIAGYDCPDAVLTAAETRTSAPLRILRQSASLQAVGHPAVYPAGEGAGYAGGITSAGVDGIRCALALMARFAPVGQ